MKKSAKIVTIIIGLLVLIAAGYYFVNKITFESKVAEKELKLMDAEKDLKQVTNKVKLEDCLNDVNSLVSIMEEKKEKTDVVQEVKKTSEDSCYAKYK